MKTAYFLLEEDDIIQNGDEARFFGGGDPHWGALGEFWIGKKASECLNGFPWTGEIRRLPENMVCNKINKKEK